MDGISSLKTDITKCLNRILDIARNVSIGVQNSLGKAIAYAANIACKSLKNRVAYQIDEKTFREHPRIPLADIWSDPNWLDLQRISFLHTYCMISQKDLQGKDKVTWIGDKGVLTSDDLERKDSIFCAGCRILDDIRPDQAEKRGFILSDDDKKRLQENPNLKIRPLMINCYGVSSSDTKAQALAGLKNGYGTDMSVVENAVNNIKAYIAEVKQRPENENVIVVPYITGHSLGGMFALAISSKEKIGSCLFNPWGAGAGLCEYIGKDDWEEANKNSEKHLVFSTKYDFTSSEESPFKQFVKIPGQIIPVENEGLGDHLHPVDTHTQYRKVFAGQIEKMQDWEMEKVKANYDFEDLDQSLDSSTEDNSDDFEILDEDFTNDRTKSDNFDDDFEILDADELEDNKGKNKLDLDDIDDF